MEKLEAYDTVRDPNYTNRYFSTSAKRYSARKSSLINLGMKVYLIDDSISRVNGLIPLPVVNDENVRYDEMIDNNRYFLQTH